MDRAISPEERKWREEDDARTLAQAEKIKNDPTRLAGAKSAAKRMVTEEREELKAMAKVAGKDSTSPGAKTASSGPKKRANAYNIFNRI